MTWATDALNTHVIKSMNISGFSVQKRVNRLHWCRFNSWCEDFCCKAKPDWRSTMYWFTGGQIVASPLLNLKTHSVPTPPSSIYSRSLHGSSQSWGIWTPSSYRASLLFIYFYRQTGSDRASFYYFSFGCHNSVKQLLMPWRQQPRHAVIASVSVLLQHFQTELSIPRPPPLPTWTEAMWKRFASLDSISQHLF